MLLKFSRLFSFHFLLALCTCVNTISAQYTPYFQNYNLTQYDAGNQNWGISKAKDGKLYVANNNGLLEFDGLKWTINALPNRTMIRAVLTLDDKIYIGSYEEFGYWKKDHKGDLNYTSLSEKLDAKEFLNEEFWQIIEYRKSIIFRSFLNVYIYKDGQITKVKPPSTVISCDVVDGDLFVSTLNDGIFILKKDQLIPFIQLDQLVDSKVISISKIENKLFIATSLKGCFWYQNNELVSWEAPLNDIIKQHQLNSYTLLGNGNNVFGTIKNGVYITTKNGEIVYHINRENGLINNTVLSQYVDENDELWLGFDNGLASIDLKSKHSFYNDITGKLGAVYDVVNFDNTIYIGSNTGLYYLDERTNLQFVNGSQGQVWDLKIIKGELFCGHNNGTYLVGKDKFQLISSFTGGWVIKKVPEQSDTYIQGTYAGLIRYKYQDGRWNVKHLGKTTIPSRFLVFENPSTAWVAHAYKGLYKVNFNKNYDSIVKITDYEHKGLWSDYNVRIYKIKNDICIKTNSGWQKYEPLLDSIVPYKLLNDTFGNDAYIISEDDLDTLAVKNQNVINFMSFPNQNYKQSLINKYFKKRLVVGYEKISKFNDSTYALSLNDGFMLIDNKQNSNNNGLQTPKVEQIVLNQEKLDLFKKKKLELPNNFNNLTITLSSSKSKNHFFEYAIANIDSTHWFRMENEKLDISNINQGDYDYLFRASNFSGDISPIRNLKFTVLPPWYKAKSGFVIYTLLLALLIASLYYLYRRKMTKEQKLLQSKFEIRQKEILKEKTLENERRIVELKNDSLKNEVKLKSKQLANTAMALVKKNETLLELKRDILMNKNSFENHFSFKKLVKRIDNSIAHKDEWKVFEYNFNQVHEEFFNQLQNEFPQLTPKDLKICAYVKMNLTTKEIAPLLNISTRGVETHRYRLRRKLNLDSDNSLTTYLRNYK